MAYWGKELCKAVKANGDKCANNAYYKVGDELLCGVHSGGKKKDKRVELPHHPQEKEMKENEIKEHNEKCDKVALKNKEAGKKGVVTLCKMKMMKNVGFMDGVVNIFPNFKHLFRSDGIGLPSLSPKSIGPVEHPQPGLPAALNLENFHQGNKVFPCEVDEKGEIKEEFFKTQLEMYRDKTPHRHKEVSGGVNVPLYSLWKDKEGVAHKISYFESRQFYCVYYERATLENPDFYNLKGMIDEGYNLRICGYDAYEVKNKSAEECYCDVSRPFGHELVLYVMLTESEENWPWRKYKTFDF
jgi:hypothetical protein